MLQTKKIKQVHSNIRTTNYLVVFPILHDVTDVVNDEAIGIYGVNAIKSDNSIDPSDKTD